MLDTSVLEVGRDYRVNYLAAQARSPRSIIAGYLDFDGTDTFWDLRPQAGTVRIPKHWIQAIWETDDPRHLPRRIRDEKRVF